MAQRFTVDELFARHAQHVLRRARRLLGNDADAQEAAQEVFIRAMKSVDSFEGDDPGGWLYRITTNHCLNQLRDAKRRRELFEAHVLPAASRSTEDKPDKAMLLRWLLSNAEPQQAQCAIYVYLDELTYTEVAEVMGVARRTVSNLMDRFRAWAKAQVSELPREGAT
jgi:RNA polymerase sigma-70 factor, ECF subfamily